VSVKSEDAAERELLALDQAALSSASAGAAATHDVGTLAVLYSVDFLLHSPANTVMSRDQVLEAARRGARRESFWYESYVRITEFVRVLGDVGVTMGSESVVPGSGPDAGRRVERRFTHVYRKENGAWKLLVRHANSAATR
jgi:ketosteroid isomerase-like protein